MRVFFRARGFVVIAVLPYATALQMNVPTRGGIRSLGDARDPHAKWRIDVLWSGLNYDG